MSMRTVCVILGGGRGTRLSPLTRLRAKPAVPLAGKYRLIDIPISNCINSGMMEIYVLTQFLSASLHQHVARTYRFDMFSKGHVELLAAEQTDAPRDDWYQGTADAVRKQLHQFVRADVREVVILSGDHLYRMDYRELVQTHRDLDADVTVSTLPVGREDCSGFGMLSLDGGGRVRDFVEKPGADVELERFSAPAHMSGGLGDRHYLASMGIYVFRPEVLREVVGNPLNNDFGRDILPAMMHTHRVVGHLFDGYWEDIGTIRSFYRANLMLTRQDSPFRFFTPEAPIYTHPRFLPAALIEDAHVRATLLSDGCIVRGAEIADSVIGIRTRIKRGARIRESVLMGADFFETAAERALNQRLGVPDMGIGRDCLVERAIIDKNARIGEGCVIQGGPGPEVHTESWSRVDGVIVIPKGVTIAPGTEIR